MTSREQTFRGPSSGSGTSGRRTSREPTSTGPDSWRPTSKAPTLREPTSKAPNLRGLDVLAKIRLMERVSTRTRDSHQVSQNLHRVPQDSRCEASCRVVNRPIGYGPLTLWSTSDKAPYVNFAGLDSAGLPAICHGNPAYLLPVPYPGASCWAFVQTSSLPLRHR
jgi:hypothetical protein